MQKQEIEQNATLNIDSEEQTLNNQSSQEIQPKTTTYLISQFIMHFLSYLF